MRFGRLHSSLEKIIKNILSRGIYKYNKDWHEVVAFAPRSLLRNCMYVSYVCLAVVDGTKFLCWKLLCWKSLWVSIWFKIENLLLLIRSLGSDVMKQPYKAFCFWWRILGVWHGVRFYALHWNCHVGQRSPTVVLEICQFFMSPCFWKS